jgi:hypothetical protein
MVATCNVRAMLNSVPKKEKNATGLDKNAFIEGTFFTYSLGKGS